MRNAEFKKTTKAHKYFNKVERTLIENGLLESLISRQPTSAPDEAHWRGIGQWQSAICSKWAINLRKAHVRE
jgi:hypothetical protein